MTARLFARLARAHSLFTCAIARVWDVCAPRFLARLRGRDARASFARAIVRVWAHASFTCAIARLGRSCSLLIGSTAHPAFETNGIAPRQSNDM